MGLAWLQKFSAGRCLAEKAELSTKQQLQKPHNNFESTARSLVASGSVFPVASQSLLGSGLFQLGGVAGHGPALLAFLPTRQPLQNLPIAFFAIAVHWVASGSVLSVAWWGLPGSESFHLGGTSRQRLEVFALLLTRQQLQQLQATL